VACRDRQVLWKINLLNRRRQKGEAKAAARVVQGDLAIAASRLKDMGKDDHRWFGYDDLRLSHWADYEGPLAPELTAADWEVVSQSALELRGLSEGMERALGSGGPHEDKPFVGLSKNSIGKLRLMWENATKAYNVLAPLAENEPVSGLLHEEPPSPSPADQPERHDPPRG
jgi:hypothetical protein